MDVKLYLEKLSTQLSFSVERISPELMTLISACENVSDINKLIFENLETIKNRKMNKEDIVKSIGEERVKILANVYDRHTIEMKRRIDSRIANINQYEANKISELRELNRLVESLESTKGINYEEILLNELSIIEEDGWYSLDIEYMDKLFTSSNDRIIVFSTPNIVLNGVNLGSFRVKFSPKFRGIGVYPCKDNIFVSNYYHPHVNTGGDVCWGNAQEVYSRSIDNGLFSKALFALRTLLCNYNPDSPYKKLSLFDDVLRNNSNSCLYKPASSFHGAFSTVEVYDDDADFNRSVYDYESSGTLYDESYEDEDGDTIEGDEIGKRLLLYVPVDSSGNRVGSDYFIKTIDGAYESIDVNAYGDIE